MLIRENPFAQQTNNHYSGRIAPPGSSGSNLRRPLRFKLRAQLMWPLDVYLAGIVRTATGHYNVESQLMGVRLGARSADARPIRVGHRT
jgi:hypothetical protein